MTVGRKETKTIPNITYVKLFLTAGIFPKKNPENISNMTQAIPPIRLNKKNFMNFILPIPATKGAKVRMIGINLDRMIALPPCFL